MLLGSALLKKIAHYDIWYHLVIGREVARSAHVPANEFYVYPMLGSPTGFHEYGFGLLFFAAHSWFGHWGMSLLNAAVGATALIVISRAATAGRDSWFMPLVLLSPLLWLIDYRMHYRAEAFLFLALAAEIYFLERYLVEAKPRWLLPLPGLAVLLTNIHPSALLLLIMLAAYLPQALLDHARTTRDFLRLSGWFGGIMVASALASAVNPSGFAQLLLPLSFAGQNRLLGATSEFFPTLQTSRGPVLLCLYAVGVLALGLPRRLRAVDGLVLLFFGVLGFQHVRNVALLALATYVPIARCLEERLAFLATGAGRALGYAFALVLLGLSTAVAARSPLWGAGVAHGLFPVETATLIATQKPPGRIFNYPHLGGYLAWRLYDEYLVAVDGRHYYGWDKSLEVADAVFAGGERHEKLLREYGVTMIATPGTVQFLGSLVPLVPILDADDGWALVKAEPAGLLFMRKDVARSKGIEMLSKDLIWQCVADDARHVLQATASPAPGVYLSLGIAHLKLGDFGESEAWLSRYVAATPGDKSAAQFLQLVEAALQGDPQAQHALEKILRSEREPAGVLPSF